MGDVVNAAQAPAEFLFLRQLGQGVNLRLSSPLDIAPEASATNLLCLSNARGLLFAATDDGFIVHKLSDVRAQIATAPKNTTPLLDPWRSIATTSSAELGGGVRFLRVANQHSALAVGLTNGRIAFWQLDQLENQVNCAPQAILQPPSQDVDLIELAPNPSDRPELCAVLYASRGQKDVRRAEVSICNIQTGQWQGKVSPPEETSATCLSWSVKGKQIVLGLDNGGLAQITPEGDIKKNLLKAQGLDADYYVEHVLWLENNVFVVTYNVPQTTDEPEHQYEVFALLRDPTNDSLTSVRFDDPAPPFGDTTRYGHRYVSWLRSWEPMKHMLFMANTSSTDVGLLGCSTKNAGASAWQVLELEDTSRPALPFSTVDKGADTCPVGLEIDFTAQDNVDDPLAAARGEDGKGKMDAVPILLIYTNDGVLLAYHVINTDAKAGKYTDLTSVSVAKAAPSSTAQTSVSTSEPSAAKPALTTQSSTPVSFGQSSTFGAPSSSPFGSTPAFGQPASIVGAKQASPFATAATSSGLGATNAFSSSGSGGFGAFAAKAGSVGFGASRTTSNDESAFAQPSAFGAKATPSSAAQTSASDAQSAFVEPSPTPNLFGQSSAFGAATGSALGSAPSFGQLGAIGGAMQASPFATTAGASFGASTSAATPSFGQSASTVGIRQASPFATAVTRSGLGATNAFSSSGSGGFGAFAAKASTVGFGASTGTIKSEPAFASTFGTKAISSPPAKTSTPSTFSSEQKPSWPTPSSTPFSFGASTDSAQRKSAFEPSPAFGAMGSTPAPVSSVAKSEAKASSSTPFSFGASTDSANSKSAFEPSSAFGAMGITSQTSTVAPVHAKHEPSAPSAAPFSLGQDSSFAESTSPVSSSSPSSRGSTPVEEAKRQNDENSESANDAKAMLSLASETSTSISVPSDIKPALRKSSSKDVGIKSVSFAKEVRSPAAQTSTPASLASNEESAPTERSTTPPLSLGKKGSFGASTSSVFGSTSGFGQPAPTGDAKQASPIATPASAEFGLSNSASIPPASLAKTMPPVVADKSSPASLPLDAKPVLKAPSSTPFSFAQSSSLAASTKAPFSGHSAFGQPASIGGTKKSSPLAMPSSAGFGAPKSADTTSASALPSLAAQTSAPSSGSSQVKPAQTKPTLTPVSFGARSGTTNGESALAPSSTKSGSFKPSTPPAVATNGPSSGSSSLASSSGKRETGLQGIFLQTYETMEKELEALRQNVERCASMHNRLRYPVNASLNMDDLGDAGKWTFGELDKKDKLAERLAQSIRELDAQGLMTKASVREIQSEQLKVESKREEIARFLRARRDSSLRKMIKVRQLGPEHADNQAKLRKAYASLQESIEELDAHLAKTRESLLNDRLGKPHQMQAPSLDAIRRAVRNMTRTAEARLMELEELELTMTSMYSTRGSKEQHSLAGLHTLSLDGGNGDTTGHDHDFPSFDAVDDALPTLDAFGKDNRAQKAYQAHRRARDVQAVFLKARSQPVLNTRMRNGADSMYGRGEQESFHASDLNMTFARGTIRVTDEREAQAPAIQETQNTGNAGLAGTTTSNSVLATPSFGSVSFGLPPTSALPAASMPATNFNAILPPDAFDLPPESAPFAPGSSGGFGLVPGIRPHHGAKSAGKRKTAVALPSASGTTSTNAMSDFFAAPPTSKPQSSGTPSKPTFTFK